MNQSTQDIKSLQSILDHEQIIMIKLTPLPYTTTLESITSWISTLSNSPYNLPKPRFIDLTKDFNQSLLIYTNPNDQLISNLFNSIQKLNQIQINLLENQRLISVGINNPSKIKLNPIKFKFIPSGYLSNSILGLYSSSNLLTRNHQELTSNETNNNFNLKRKSDWNSIIIKQKKIKLNETKDQIKKENLKQDSLKLIEKRSNRLTNHQKLINLTLEKKTNQFLICHNSFTLTSESRNDL